jgi:hypothetical protein
MSLKPDVVPQPVVIEQVKVLVEQRYRLTVEAEQLQNRLKQIEIANAENGVLADRVKALLSESLGLFEEEWRHRCEFYPDLWLGALEQALVVVQPPAKKK